MEADDLNNLVNLVEDRARFVPLRCLCSDQNDEMVSILRETFEMIALNNRTLVSCCDNYCMQWEITDDTVQLVRCIIKTDDGWDINGILSLDDGTRFFIYQGIYQVQSKVSLHHIDFHAPLCEIIIDHCLYHARLIPLSIDQILDWTRQDIGELLVYSMKNSGQHHSLTLLDADYLDISKLPGVNDVVVILYKHYIDIRTVTGNTSTLLDHYVFQSDYTELSMKVIDRSHIILISKLSSRLQAETLLCLKEFNIVSETLMSNGTNHDLYWVHPFHGNCVIINEITYTKNKRLRETKRDIFKICSLDTKKQYTITASLYNWENRARVCFMLPNTLDFVVFTQSAKFFKYTIPQELAVHMIKYAELRKNARVLYQAHRTLSSHFARVPVEICLKIIALTDISLPDDMARRLASVYFCRPSCDIS